MGNTQLTAGSERVDGSQGPRAVEALAMLHEMNLDATASGGAEAGTTSIVGQLGLDRQLRLGATQGT